MQQLIQLQQLSWQVDIVQLSVCFDLALLVLAVFYLKECPGGRDLVEVVELLVQKRHQGQKVALGRFGSHLPQKGRNFLSRIPWPTGVSSRLAFDGGSSSYHG